MGCSGSSSNAPAVDPSRKRLSIGQVDKPDGSDGGPLDASAVTEEDRGLIAKLNGQGCMDLLNEAVTGNGGRRYSIGSKTDQGKTSFAAKPIAKAGLGEEPIPGLGYTCRKGLKPESPNQDSFFVLKCEPHFSIYGVFDGHGQKGHDVSEFVKENLPKMIIRDERFQNCIFKEDGNDHLLKDVCIEQFEKIQSLILTLDQTKKMDAKLAGTTCTVAIHDHVKQKLTVAHVADSTAVLGKSDATAVQLTRDHKPDLPDERARIEKAGGRVVFDGYANHRIYAKAARYPGLNMSRCLGDLMGHADCGITATPEVTQRDVVKEDMYLLLCSDGVWEFITPKEAVAIVAEYPPAQAQQAADLLAKAAWDRWIKEEGGAVVDDITVVLQYLIPPSKDPT